MDRLTGEHKNIPTYAENLYKWTPEPSVLKQDVLWDTPIIEDLECPYCKKENPKRLLDNLDWDMIEVYISKGSLWVNSGDYDIFEFKNINFCPMCGRQFK